jgi:hypothetical protein
MQRKRNRRNRRRGAGKRSQVRRTENAPLVRMTDKSSLPFNYPSTIVMTGSWAPSNTASLDALDFSDYTNYLTAPCVRMIEQFQEFRLLEVNARILFRNDDSGAFVNASFSESEIYTTEGLGSIPGRLVLVPSYKANQRLTSRWVSKSFGDLSFWPVPVVLTPVPVFYYYYCNIALTDPALVIFNIVVQVRGISSWNQAPSHSKLFKSVKAYEDYRRMHVEHKVPLEVGK